jgi:uncharacterized protein (DUF2141 family)
VISENPTARPPSQQLMAPGNFCRTCFVSSLLAVTGPGVIAGQTPPCPGIHVTILNIRNSTGTVDCALFDSPNGFPVDVLRSAMRLVAMKVPDTEARCDLENVRSGTYALVVLHDENMNGKLDTNWLGLPRKGYGFSKDVKATFGAPSFSDASFPYDGQTLEMTITLRY